MNNSENNLNLTELLEYVNPVDCSYSEWVQVGMALKTEGYTAADWDAWSRRDPGRYHPGECWRKWDTFQGASSPVTGGTIVQMAKDNGWRPAYSGDDDTPLEWDDIIGSRETGVIVDKSWVERREVTEPECWDPVEQLTRYLETLFASDENVGYVTESWQKDGRHMPTKGSWDRTAGQLIQQLNQCGGDIGAVIGDCDPAAGAWIRFNPLDGKGCKNENVTDYRYALVESDTMELDQQHALIRELKLPVACLVYSGGKSLHAIVRIEAATYEEYRKRVDYLYAVLQKNGLKVDTQNKNPSRLSRMPGVLRNGHKQFLLDTNLGKSSWAEWREWIEAATDDLPDFQNISDVWDNPPPLTPELIQGVLRKGHKMMLAGASKTGKSVLLTELAISISEGLPWLGFQCAKGKVLYINFEIDPNTFWNRLLEIYRTLNLNSSHNIDVWNLRGHATAMDKLTPKLIRRACKQNYAAIIIDPIYKVLTGDENSADQMAAFCNQFDRIAQELNCSVIYCHHHSKGAQGGKESMDRASGSGVFARDADALLDMVKLDVPSKINTENRIALRVEGTLREFPSFQPFDVWFQYPLHKRDTEGILAEAKPRNEKSPQQLGTEAAANKRAQEREKRNLDMLAKFVELSKSGSVSTTDMQKAFQTSKATIKDWIDACPYLERDNFGTVWRVEIDESDIPEGWGGSP